MKPSDLLLSLLPTTSGLVELAHWLDAEDATSQLSVFISYTNAVGAAEAMSPPAPDAPPPLDAPAPAPSARTRGGRRRKSEGEGQPGHGDGQTPAPDAATEAEAVEQVAQVLGDAPRDVSGDLFGDVPAAADDFLPL